MAKSKSFFGMRTGSTKSHTYQVLKGLQITKDRVEHVNNPRSTAQMRQRLTFASAALFYKRAIQNLFKFAFEGKKQTESDYNAFMRANVSLAPTLSKWMLDRKQYTPSIAPWILSQGSLDAPNLTVDPVDGEVLALVANPIPATNTTGGDIAKGIIAQYPSLKDGDILTHVQVCASGISANDVADAENSDTFIIAGGEDFAPLMQIRQVRLNVADETPITDATSPWNEICGGVVTPDGSAISYVRFLGFKGLDEDYATMGLAPYAEDSRFMYGSSIIFSRPLAGGVKVSSSALLLNDETNKAYGIGRNDSWRNYAASTYETIEQTSADNILQGSLLAPSREIPSGNLIAQVTPALPNSYDNVALLLTDPVGFEVIPVVGEVIGKAVITIDGTASELDITVEQAGSTIDAVALREDDELLRCTLNRGSKLQMLSNGGYGILNSVELYKEKLVD